MRFAVAVVVVVAGCASDPVGVLTDSTCPTADKPTYDNFGMKFFTDYCTSCHSQTKVGDDRNGAPPTIDFDTVALIRDNTSRIDKQAAFGMTIKNRIMPPDTEAAIPTDDERVRLGQYIACIVGR